jgi:acyl-CoA thioester hydrolase
MRKRRKDYFIAEEGAPASLCCSVEHRVLFGEVDAMAIMWHGNYARLFEMASTELRGRIGLSYEDFFVAELRAPIVQLHVDYHQPLVLDEVARIQAELVWSDAARINIQYTIFKADQSVAVTGYTVQLFTDAAGAACWVMPEMLAQSQKRWKAGEFKELSVS